MRPPLLSIVGKTNVGKTTFLEGLIAELKRRSYRVAAIKHSPHGFEIDQPGKDSWRLAQAGSDAVVLASPAQLALMRRVPHDVSLEEIASLLGEDFDIILTEGYKEGPAAKIEVHRRERGDLLCAEGELLALITDEPLELPAPQFSFDQAGQLVDFLEAEGFLGGRAV